MRIGELAKRGDCDVETVRFYEREGLLDAPAREANGYRRYAQAQLLQLNFIRHCRSLGMALPDIRVLRGCQENPALACHQVNGLIDRQLDRIRQQLSALSALEQQLHSLRASCHGHAEDDATAGGEHVGTPGDGAVDILNVMVSTDAFDPVPCGIMRNLEAAAEGEGCSCHPENMASH